MYSNQFTAISMKGNYHVLIIKGGTIENVYLDGAIITDSYAVLADVAAKQLPPVIKPENEQSNTFWLGLVSLLGMGTGSDAKFLFALIIIITFGAIGLRASGNIAMAFTFGSYIWFTYIDFIPKWIFIIAVILIIIVAKIFR